MLYLKGGFPIPYKNGKLKTNDIVEVNLDTSESNMSFWVNGVNYGVAFTNIPNESLCPVVLINDQNVSIELIE